MKAILQLVSEQTGIDFLKYKKSTLKRRLEKRLNTLGFDDYKEYYTYLRNNPEEVGQAFSEMLLGISEFFRDPQVFQKIRERLGKIIARKKKNDPIRIWSIGCSCGEEPLSIAILLAELLEDFEKRDIKIFASDISEYAINAGRKGLYSEKSLQNLSRDQIDKYFNEKEDGFEVKEFLRKVVVFCRHDITKDPPFLNIDLITCRNLLIYFNADLQNKVIPVFNYSLVDYGYLVIGKSENIEAFRDLLELVDTKHKIYKNKENQGSRDLQFFNFQKFYSWEQGIYRKGEDEKPTILEMARETIAKTYEHPYVVVNSHHKIIETQGELRAYMGFNNGDKHILELVNEELHHELHTGLIKCQKNLIPITTNEVHFKLFEKDYRVQMVIQPVVYGDEPVEYFLIIFKGSAKTPEVSDPDRQDSGEKDLSNKDFLIESLREELKVAKEQLETYRKQLEASEAETQSLTEELQSANEELKSANEELETSNEELQSLNEELNSKNQELREINEALEKSKQELGEREAKLRLVTENTRDIITLQNEEGLITYITPSVEGILGFKPEEVLNMPANDLIHPEDLKVIQQEGEQYLAEGKASAHEYRVKTKEGNYTYVETVTVPIFDDDGNLIQVQNASREITERKNYEKKIRLLSRFPEDNPNPVLTISENGEFLYANPVGEPFITYWQEQYNQSFPPDFYNVIQEALKKGHSQVFESKIGDGHYQITINPNQEGYFVFLYAMDITQQKQAEHELRQHKQLLESINQHINEGIFRSTPESGVIYVNEPFAKIFGYDSTEDVLKTQGLELYADPEERERLIEKEQEEGGFQNQEVLFKRKDGSTFWGLLSSKRLLDEYGKVFYDGAVRDITKQKEVENKLVEAKEKAEEMNRLKTNFLANMSHEIRTPINGIMGLVQVMEDEYSDVEGVNSYARMIRESSERLLKTITSILDFSKLEAKEVNLRPSIIEVNSKINALQPHLKVLADKKGIDFINDLAGGQYYVQIDENVLEQILNNLVGNAVKFTEEGFVKIRTRIKDERKEKFIIEVIDTGIGISEENIEKIFSPFEQESEGHGRDYEGTGLGLSIVKKYVELFGGTIKVTSKKGEGSTFQITMPLTRSLEESD